MQAVVEREVGIKASNGDVWVVHNGEAWEKETLRETLKGDLDADEFDSLSIVEHIATMDVRVIDGLCLNELFPSDDLFLTNTDGSGINKWQDLTDTDILMIDVWRKI